jgi:hypothetical protein
MRWNKALRGSRPGNCRTLLMAQNSIEVPHLGAPTMKTRSGTGHARSTFNADALLLAPKIDCRSVTGLTKANGVDLRRDPTGNEPRASIPSSLR